MLNYYWRWLKTALTHSLGQMDLWIGAVGAVFTVVDHWRPGNEISPLFAWIIPILTLICVLGLRLLLAPFWMSQADAAKIRELSLALDDRDAKNEALKQLWGLRRNGVVLRNQEIGQGDQIAFVDWNRQFEDWRRAVLIHAQTISINLENWLETLNEVGLAPARANPYHSEVHAKNTAILSEMLRRMERFLEKEL